MGSLGPLEIGLIFLAILLLFGAKRIPEIARGLGKGIREFKDATNDIKRELTVDDQYNRIHAPRPPQHQGYAQQPYGQQAPYDQQQGYAPQQGYQQPYGQQPYGQPPHQQAPPPPPPPQSPPSSLTEPAYPQGTSFHQPAPEGTINPPPAPPREENG